MAELWVHNCWQKRIFGPNLPKGVKHDNNLAVFEIVCRISGSFGVDIRAARDGCLHFSAILAAAQGSHLPIIQKSSHWISCRLPLFLSFSPGSTQLLNNPPVTVTWQQGQIELGMEVVYKKQIEIAYFMSTIVYWYPQPPQGYTGIYTGLIYSHAV